MIPPGMFKNVTVCCVSFVEDVFLGFLKKTNHVGRIMS